MEPTSGHVSSKRSLPSTSHTPTAKRPRPSPTSIPPERCDNDEDADEQDDAAGPLDESASARKARKDARTIRNRQSAQRSRDARKARHEWLEVRVVELEEENRRLRGQTPSTESTSARTCITSPSIYPTSPIRHGISLAEVAPPPSEIDVKPILHTPIPPPMSELDRLRADNAALRARLSAIEDLSRAAQANPSPPIPLVESLEPLDWNSFFTTTFVESTPRLPSPPLIDLPLPMGLDDILTSAPVIPYTAPSTQPLSSSLSAAIQPLPTLYSLPHPSNLNIFDSTQQSIPNLPLACHPAAVATHSVPTERSLQRARTDSGLISGVSTVVRVDSAWIMKRIDWVARLLVAMAKLRGWIPSSPSQKRARAGLRKGRRARRCDLRKISGAPLSHCGTRRS